MIYIMTHPLGLNTTLHPHSETFFTIITEAKYFKLYLKENMAHYLLFWGACNCFIDFLLLLLLKQQLSQMQLLTTYIIPLFF
jgi:hypothetical protein